MNHLKRVLCFLLAVVMLLSLVACAGKETTTEPAQTTTDTTEPADTAATPADSEESDADTTGPKKGGSITIIDPAEVTSMLWYNIQTFDDKFQSMLTVYETLFRCNDDGTISGYLADSYESDQDAKTYTIKLKEGIKFHDGSELTAEVAAWCLEEYRQNGIKSAAFFSNIDSFEVIDDYTFRINLSNWDATIPYSLARECGIMASKQAFDTQGVEYLESHPVGTGPFMFESMTRDVEKVFVKFADYWQGEPNLDSVVIKIYADSLVSQAAMQNGDADVLYCTDYDLVNTLTAAGCEANLGLPSQIAMLCFNCTDEENNPFYDVKVRQAICHAIDKDALLTGIYSGFGTVTNQFATEGSVFYNEDVQGYAYDVELAKQMLAEAGYPDGFDTTLIVRNDTMQINCVTAIQSMLAKIGVNVAIDIQDSGDFSANLTGWHTGMFFHTASLPIDVVNQMGSIFRQGLSGIVLGLSSMIRSDELNERIVAAITAGDSDESQANLRSAQPILIDELCDLDPIVTVYQPVITSSKLHDHGINAVEYTAGTLYKAWVE